ncbi:MAG: Cytochrome c oxidase subunit [Chloroflexota bacterium]|jgi:hypothetical protein|nr:Cytochrome c oxidase subunit [Chloroflexota bacterium]
MADDETTAAGDSASPDADGAEKARDTAAGHAAGGEVHGGHDDGDAIHMPPNSWWPLVTSIGICIAMLGLISVSELPFIMIGGLVVMFVGIGGWVYDARREYRELH